MAKNASLLVTSDNKQDNIKITPDCAYYNFTLIDSDITLIKTSTHRTIFYRYTYQYILKYNINKNFAISITCYCKMIRTINLHDKKSRNYTCSRVNIKKIRETVENNSESEKSSVQWWERVHSQRNSYGRPWKDKTSKRPRYIHTASDISTFHRRY